MPEITLGDLLAAITAHAGVALESSAAQTAGVTFQVSELAIDIPAYLSMRAAQAPADLPAVILALPSLRETPAAGRLGRLHVVIRHRGADSPSEEAL